MLQTSAGEIGHQYPQVVCLDHRIPANHASTIDANREHQLQAISAQAIAHDSLCTVMFVHAGCPNKQATQM